ncbi:MAG: PLP-dependent aspartate aminotransferase family protein [Pseudomonadota bacterium]
MTDEPETHAETAQSAAEAFAVAGGGHDAATGAVLPSINLAATFARNGSGDNAGAPSGMVYGRDENAGVMAVEETLRRLEGGEGPAYVFSSGMSAAIAALLALGPGAKLLAPDVMYWALRSWLVHDAPRHGLSVTFADMTDLEAVQRHVADGNATAIWVETPGNPLWNITDIAEVCALARAHGACVICDSTVATPVLTRPLALGADVVMHSATKYLNGHSDVLAGALVFARDDALAREARRMRQTTGPLLSPFDAMLLQRGLRTLHVRVRAQSQSALKIAEHFANHSDVEAVLYPGLPSAPGHAVASAQMTGGYSGMLSLRLRGGASTAIRVCAATRVWTDATSLGGTESLIEHRASVEGPTSPVPDDLLRLSTGLEPVDLLIDDLERAIAFATGKRSG